jgi:hypothetical protein
MNFFKTIEAQEFGQLKSVDAVAPVGVFGNPGIGDRMHWRLSVQCLHSYTAPLQFETETLEVLSLECQSAQQ